MFYIEVVIAVMCASCAVLMSHLVCLDIGFSSQCAEVLEKGKVRLLLACPYSTSLIHSLAYYYFAGVERFAPVSTNQRVWTVRNDSVSLSLTSCC